MPVLQNLDGSMLLFLQQARVEWLNVVFTHYTVLGDKGLLWIGLSLLLLCRKSTRRAGATALLALALGALCTNVALKHLIARPRPWLDVAGLVPLVNEADPNSFPSGHTCAAFAAGLAWALTAKKGWVWAVSLGAAVLMGFSRLYVGVHYPSDVLVGAVIGTVSALVACRAVSHWEKRMLQKKIG